MADAANLNTVVVQTLEQQVDLMTSQRDILTRVERLLIRLLEAQGAADGLEEEGFGAVETFFSKQR